MFPKKIIYLSALLLVSFVFNTNCIAQKNKKTESGNSPDDYYGDNRIRYEDYVYRKFIKSVLLHDESFDLSQPVLNLDSEEKLILSFDDLDGGLKTYTYTFIHCNADWQPDDLQSSEYIDGFTDNAINNYRYSYNTLQKYTHYSTVFPTATTRFTKSGNYILKVYLDGNPEKIAITKRFMVYQNKIMIQSRVTPASIIEDRNYKQELDFTIDHTGYPIANPFGDLKIVITQNNRWDNIKTNFKPVFVKDMELVYDYDQENVFPGGNEFRYFDIKSIRYHSERIYAIKTDSLGPHVTLVNDENRSFKRYSTYIDINGKFLIKVDEGTNSDVEAEYCYVNFFLPYDGTLADGNLYVFGAFNGWSCNQENLMHYNEKRFGYECTLYLKQGYYNYEYVFLKDGTTMADETMIEGSHYETENDYTIYVYHHQQGTFYDQLIGVKRLNSMKN